jgi:HTH-type transcriptional regulator/antitoxin HigA
MTMAIQLALPDELPKTYTDLVAVLVPRPIHDKISYDNTVAMIDALAGKDLNRDQEDYLEILSQLVEVYEEAHLKPYPRASGIKLLKYLLEENSMNGDDLAGLLEIDRSVAYKILKSTRSLTTGHIRRICGRFAIGADALLE